MNDGIQKGRPLMAKTFKTKAKTPKGILQAAARVIRDRGWVQGHPHGDNGEVDVTVAILTAVDGTDESEGTKQTLRILSARLLKQRIGIDEAELIFPWNDAEGRTKDEVLAILEGK